MDGLAVLSYVGVWAGIVGGIVGFASIAAMARTPQQKAEFGNWIKSVSFIEIEKSWASSWIKLFDQIFGDSFFHRRCIFLAMGVSLGTVTLMVLLWGSRYPHQLESFLNWAYENKAWSVLFLIPFNFIPDFLSLFFSRKLIGYANGWIVNQSSNRFASIRLLGIVIVDIGITFILFFLVLLIFQAPLVFLGQADLSRGLSLFETFFFLMENSLDLLSPFPTLYSSQEHVIPVGVFLYSTFFTSLWLWIHIGVLFFITFLKRFDSVWRNMGQEPRLSEEPHYVLGYFSILFITFCMLGAAPFVLS